MSTEQPKILCVDDEPRVLEALKRHLREHFAVLTAENGAAAMDLIKEHRDLAIVLSDMRMPEMDGATLLRHTRVLQPNAVRVLLTGQADIAAAIKAINEGQIFRFLTKPCPPEQLLTVLNEAVRQHELIIAERILLQRTLVGSIRAIADIMMLVNPTVVGRAVRLRHRVAALATELRLEERWQLEAAALLAHLGQVSLPNALTHKISRGRALEADETLRLQEVTRAANRLIAHVPRLEPVSALLMAAMDVGEGELIAAEPDATQTQVLRLAMDVERLEAQGLPPVALVETVSTAGEYPPELIAALRNSLVHAQDSLERLEVPVSEIELGMILDEDVTTDRDVLIAPRGCEVTISLLDHLRHFAPQLARSKAKVVRRSGGLSVQESGRTATAAAR